MKVEGTRFVRGGRCAVLAALASVLLASCATSETDVPFGLASVAPASSHSDDFSQPTTNSAASTFVMDEDDPSLPNAVASAPSLRPVLEGETATAQAPAEEQVAAATTQAPETPQDKPTAQAAAAEPVEEQGSTDQEPTQQATQFFENAPPTQTVAAAEPRKRSFLSSFFGTTSARAAPAAQATLASASQSRQAEAAPAKPLVQLAATEQAAKPIVASAASVDGPALPGVRQNSLFEISRRSGIDDDSDIDLHEGDESYQVASAAGLARLAPNGLMKQTDRVDVACLKPSLVRVLKSVEQHYGKKVVVTSGYRSPDHNRKARGARNSLHMYCAAADVQVEGVSKTELAQFVRAMPGRGGVGTYCHTNSVHIDVGPERDWNWRCRRRK